MSIGFIKLYRAIADSPGWLEETFDRQRAWIDLILLANYKPGYVRKRGIRVELKRGDIGWSERALADRWGWSRGKLRRFLDELEADQQIVQQKNNVTNCISIVNYAKYQDVSTTDRTTSDTTSDTTNGTRIKKGKNSKEEREENASAQLSDFDGYEDEDIPEVFEDETPPPNGAQTAAERHLDEVRRTGIPQAVARSPQELYEMIADRVVKDPEWWRSVKDYCKIQHMSRGEIEIALRKWAAYIFQAREASLTSWRKLDASLQSWLLRENRPVEPEKLKL